MTQWALRSLLGCAAWLASCVAPGPAAMAGGVRVAALDAGAPVTGMSLADLDGDGLPDLIVTTTEDAPTGVRRSLAIFFQTAAGFAQKPSITRALDDQITALLTADINGDGTSELLALDDRGLLVWRRGAEGQWPEAPTRLMELAVGFYMPAADTVVHAAHAIDINRSGRDDLLLPIATGYRLLFGQPDGTLAEGPLFRAEPKTDYAEGWGSTWFNVTRRLAACVVADTDGSGRLDVALRDDDRLTIFAQRADGSFPDEGAVIELARAGNGEGGEADGADTRGRFRDRQLFMIDIDGSGRADLIVVSTEGRFDRAGSFAVTVALYKNDTPRGLPAEPTETFQLAGASLGVQLANVTGSGRPALVVPIIDTSVFANVVDRLLGRMKVVYNVFVFDGGQLGPAPAFERTAWIPFGVVEDRSDIPLASFEGDFDGSGRRDMLYRDRAGRVAVFATQRRTAMLGPRFAIASDPMWSVDVGEASETIVVDITGNGRSDLAIRHPRTGPKASQITLVLSR